MWMIFLQIWVRLMAFYFDDFAFDQGLTVFGSEYMAKVSSFALLAQSSAVLCLVFPGLLLAFNWISITTDLIWTSVCELSKFSETYSFSLEDNLMRLICTQFYLTLVFGKAINLFHFLWLLKENNIYCYEERMGNSIPLFAAWNFMQCSLKRFSPMHLIPSSGGEVSNGITNSFSHGCKMTINIFSRHNVIVIVVLERSHSLDIPFFSQNELSGGLPKETDDPDFLFLGWNLRTGISFNS